MKLEGDHVKMTINGQPFEARKLTVTARPRLRLVRDPEPIEWSATVTCDPLGLRRFMWHMTVRMRPGRYWEAQAVAGEDAKMSEPLECPRCSEMIKPNDVDGVPVYDCFGCGFVGCQDRATLERYIYMPPEPFPWDLLA